MWQKSGLPTGYPMEHPSDAHVAEIHNNINNTKKCLSPKVVVSSLLAKELMYASLFKN